MKRTILWILIALMIASVMPTTAFAAKATISMGGKVGFMYEGASVTLKPKVKNVDLNDLYWSSSDEAVATVSGGTIVANNVGRTVITASGNGASAKCGVVVLPRTIDLEEGESYSLPYGTVERYSVQHKSIANITRKGVITAKKEGTTYIRVKYGKQQLYVQVNVGESRQEDNPFESQSKAADLDCASSTSQIILVEHSSGSKATLTIHEKKNGLWQQLYSCSAYVGRNGIGKTKEGDGKTPTGTYNLTQPFGIKADPGANMDYTKVTKYHYWCGTSGSDYYNQLVDMRQTGRKNTSSDEYLINFGSVYNYCMFIDYNAEGEAGKGSCIFLHCKGSKASTGGCIAVDENVMKNIIRWAKPGAKIVIQ